MPAQDFRPPATGTTEASDEIDLLEILRTLWRGKLWIALCALLVLTLGWYRGVATAVPLYTATAQMALQLDNQPNIDLSTIVSGFSGDEASINTEMAIIQSDEVIGRLVDELRLQDDPEFNAYLPDPDAAGPGVVQRVRSALGAAVRAVLPGGEDDPAEAEAPPTPEEIRRDVIDSVRGTVDTDSNYDTYVFSISVTTEDPDKSTRLANALAGFYRDDQIRTKVETTERMATWLSERVGELRAELDAKQNEIADLQAQSALVSDESLQALNERAIDLRSQLSQVQSDLARTEERLSALAAAEASGDVEAILAAADDGQLEAAATAMARSQPGARARFDRRLAQVRLQVEAERDRARQSAQDLQRGIDELSSQFEGQSSDLRALQQLRQEAEATQALYDTFLTRLKEATVQQSAYEADSRILTEAREGDQVAPRRTRILALSLILGLVLGGGLVLGREFLQNTFRTAEDLERKTGRPVLGQIPRIPARQRGDVIRYLRDKPTSAAAEAVRNLRTSLLLSNVDRPPQVVMATSSVPNEGKTTITIALAQNFAGLDKRVLLIEGDVRRRTFAAYFQQKDGKGGLISVISGKTALEDAVLRPEGLDFDVLVGERSTTNAADLFSSQRFHQVVEEARSLYDVVIIDTPPVLVVPDARVIAQHVDAVVYVVRWDRTTGHQVEEGLKQLRSLHLPVTGVVLSQVDPKGMRRYGYGGRYGAYSRYARGYYEA
ncbi:GumC family protein [Rubellimicrobium mesophilum]|nr:polysaccharide biosynthesis tyrosine autokinase [Rubellimicrobium mesophilum]